jgi:hypothetical protein
MLIVECYRGVQGVITGLNNVICYHMTFLNPNWISSDNIIYTMYTMQIQRRYKYSSVKSNEMGDAQAVQYIYYTYLCNVESHNLE